MDNFLDKYYLRNINQDQIINVNRLITVSEMEAVVRSLNQIIIIIT